MSLIRVLGRASASLSDSWTYFLSSQSSLSSQYFASLSPHNTNHIFDDDNEVMADSYLYFGHYFLSPHSCDCCFVRCFVHCSVCWYLLMFEKISYTTPVLLVVLRVVVFRSVYRKSHNVIDEKVSLILRFLGFLSCCSTLTVEKFVF